MCVCVSWRCFEELDLTHHLVTRTLPREHVRTCMLLLDNLSGDHWPQGHSAYLHASFLEKDKGEERGNFLMRKEGRDERDPHTARWYGRQHKRVSEKGRADRIFSSEERSDRPCVYTGVLRAWQVEPRVP